MIVSQKLQASQCLPKVLLLLLVLILVQLQGLELAAILVDSVYGYLGW